MSLAQDIVARFKGLTAADVGLPPMPTSTHPISSLLQAPDPPTQPKHTIIFSKSNDTPTAPTAPITYPKPAAIPPLGRQLTLGGDFDFPPVLSHMGVSRAGPVEGHAVNLFRRANNIQAVKGGDSRRGYQYNNTGGSIHTDLPYTYGTLDTFFPTTSTTSTSQYSVTKKLAAGDIPARESPIGDRKEYLRQMSAMRANMG